MDVIIVEDEFLAAERLQILIKNYDSSINIKACLESIEEAVEFLQTKNHPDLIFLDIQLSDGHSFEIFKKVSVSRPVIFTTAFDHYALDAFRLFSIDYILKPVTKQSLAASINKYKSLANLSVADYALLGNATREQFKSPYKNRFVAKVGQKSFFIQAEEVAYFFADNKLVYLVDASGSRFVINFTLEKLAPLLDPYNFFRVNRNMIINSKAVVQIKPHLNNRLKIILKKEVSRDEVIVSRERVGEFKAWADN